MDPIIGVVACVILLLVLVGLSSPGPRRRRIDLDPVPVCRLTPEEQAKKAARRNRTMLELEEAARQRGELDPELFGNRMAAINRVPLETRQQGSFPEVG